MGALIWFVGIPGSGKSTLAGRVAEALRSRGRTVRLLRMDVRRKAYIPNPAYTDDERETAYRLFAEEGARELHGSDIVILDGTAHMLRWRQYARGLCDRFAEVYVACDLETAMAREAARPEGLVMADLYRKALERKSSGAEHPGLGKVVGVDVPFEENPDAECVVCGTDLTRGEAAEQALECLERWLAALEGGSGQRT